MKRIKVVSFDLDGTIVKRKAVDFFWLELVPRVVAEKMKVDISYSKTLVYEEYEKIGENDIRWYLPRYWAERFGFTDRLDEMLRETQRMMEVYPDVEETIHYLYSEGYTLIIASNAAREFIEMSLKSLGDLSSFFKAVFSCVSDFHIPRKNEKFYMHICSLLKVSPSEIVHIGDNPIYDYDVPLKVGFKALLLAREGSLKREKTIRSLTELKSIL